MCLARRAGVNCVELVPMLGDIFERVSLVEFVSDVMRLRRDVHADDVEARQLIAPCRATGTAE